ncbi:acylamino-acid-releasing enzyme-like isoform X3 [Rhodnius prolixus]|uniref:acylamino-acid-releasing enzyme-like isoform X3 n=1 Tax=Rhodnius prolixus TaxID=13249 RepID=UPI003D18890D
MATKQVDKIVKVLQKVIRTPTPLSGRILNVCEDSATISTVWSQASPDREITVHSETIHLVDQKNKSVRNFGAIDTTTELLTSYSSSNNYRAVLRDVPSASSKQNKRQVLEIWSKNTLWKSFDLVKFEKHGDIYTDGEFGCLEWSPCETKLLYIAEKKTPKSEPFLGPGSKKSSEATIGTEYDFIEDWGETLVGKSQPVVAICDIETEAVEVISDATFEGPEAENVWSYGQAVWAPDGASIVCVAWDSTPRRLGLVYCTKRKSYIVHIKDVNGTKEIHRLSEDGRAVRSPVFAPDKSRLVWLERDITGPHHACHRIVKYEWDSKKRSVVVDVVDKEIKTENGGLFYGIYCTSLNRPWLCDSKTLLVSTPQRASVRSFKIDTDNGNVIDISGSQTCDETFSETVLDVSRDLVFCWRSAIGLTPSLMLGCVNKSGVQDWITIIPHSPSVVGYQVDVIRLKASRTTDLVRDYSAVYFGPPLDSDVKEVPLIVWPHGGPHSSSSNTYSLLYNFFAQLGFAILLVNYRGSIGAGQSSVDWLPGRVGFSDVEDVHQAALHVLHKYGSQLDPAKTVLFGGSHGGFLVLHLAGQYPSHYKAVATRNPVTYIPPLSSTSDIPDWALVEGGFDYNPMKYELSAEEHEAMRSKSPISHVGNVVSPILFLLGKKDLRVPMSQGLDYYHALKARNIKTRAIVYEDNHGLVKVPHLIDFAVNAANWFLENIPHKLS